MANILSHVDQSIGTVHKTPKREVYKWTGSSAPGTFLLIPKTELNIDGRYQRDEVSKEKVVSIARDWDWLLFGTLCVIKRENSSFWVFDGGHRTRAAFFRDDITELPCMGHEVSSLTDEAKAFVARNTMISNVSALARFRAANCAEEPTAVRVTALLAKLGLKICKNADRPDTIKAIGSLMHCVEENPEVAERVLEFCLGLQRDGGISQIVLVGLFTLQTHFAKQEIDLLNDFGNKLLTFSQKEMEIRVRQLRAETGKGGSAIYARALLDLLNKGKRNKLEW